jgi:hypothetical protein
MLYSGFPVRENLDRDRLEARVKLAQIRLLFTVAGLYDLIIGTVFLFAGPRLFDWASVPQPNHWAYLHFGSLMLMIFGVMFLVVAREPHGQRNLIPYGMMLKLSYTGLTGYYWATFNCPTLFKPFAIIDAVMFILFFLAYRSLRPKLSP